MTRNFSEYMMWSHIFIIGEIFYAIWLKNYILGLTGIITTILSILYHQTREKYWQPWETISAHISMFYILYSAWISCISYYFYIITFLVIFTGFWHRYSNNFDKKHYELCHPWLHLLPPLTAHIYQIKC